MNIEERLERINAACEKHIAKYPGIAVPSAQSTLAACVFLLFHWRNTLPISHEALQLQAAIIEAWPDNILRNYE